MPDPSSLFAGRRLTVLALVLAAVVVAAVVVALLAYPTPPLTPLRLPTVEVT